MKALKGVVIGMGVLILLGLAVVIAAIVSRVNDGGSQTAERVESVALGLAPVCHVVAMSPADGLLALRIEGDESAACPSVILFDPASGAVQQRIWPGDSGRPAPPAPED